MPASRFPRLQATLAYLAAVLATTLAGSIAQTQVNLAALAGLGAEIGLALRLRATLDDVVGFAPAWGGIVATGLLLALPVAAWLGRRRAAWRTALFTLAGALAVLVALCSMRLALGLTAVAAARSPTGLLLLVICGAAGGWLYARLTRRVAQA